MYLILINGCTLWRFNLLTIASFLMNRKKVSRDILYVYILCFFFRIIFKWNFQLKGTHFMFGLGIKCWHTDLAEGLAKGNPNWNKPPGFRELEPIPREVSADWLQEPKSPASCLTYHICSNGQELDCFEIPPQPIRGSHSNESRRGKPFFMKALLKFLFYSDIVNLVQ